jgi:hypothetical protein
MKTQGQLIVKNDEQVITEKFTKRDFVIRTNDKYPQDIQFQLSQGNVDLIDAIRLGEQIEVEFNLRGKEYNGRYYVTLDAWKISIQQGSTQTSQPLPIQMAQESKNESQDLPF